MNIIDLRGLSQEEQLKGLLALKPHFTSENLISTKTVIFDNLTISNLSTKQLDVLIEMYKQNVPLEHFSECCSEYYNNYNGRDPRKLVDDYQRVWIETAKKNLIDESQWTEWENFCYEYCYTLSRRTTGYRVIIKNISGPIKIEDFSPVISAINIMFILKNCNTKIPNPNLYYEIIKQFDVNHKNHRRWYDDNYDLQMVCYIIETFCPEYYEYFKELICYDEATKERSGASMAVTAQARKLRGK